MPQIFTCPEHTDVVLFEENLVGTRLMTFAETKYCPKCKKYYFVEECLLQIQENNGDGN